MSESGFRKGFYVVVGLLVIITTGLMAWNLATTSDNRAGIVGVRADLVRVEGKVDDLLDYNRQFGPYIAAGPALCPVCHQIVPGDIGDE